MTPIENEPKGWDENQQNNASDFDLQTDKETKAPEVNTSASDIAGNAAGNTATTAQDEVDEHASNEDVLHNDPRGFMGDFAEPQHDDEVD